MRAVLRLGLLTAILAPIPAIAADRLDAAVGKALFTRDWLPAPASTTATDGLGPLMDARGCAGCHPSAGPARLAVAADGALSGLGLTLRLGDANGHPDPVYGRQLQRQAVPPLTPEAAWRLVLAEDGSAPALMLDGLASGPLASAPSVRSAPDLRGLGALDALPEAVIFANADPDDLDGDGISGRPNRDPRTGRLGRFGHKAIEPSLRTQAETAFFLDLGLATPGEPRPEGDCTPAEPACLAAPQGAETGAPELPDPVVDAVVAYLDSLRPAPVPVGGELFTATGCTACHKPMLGAAPAGSDLLLHDLGPGLADGMGEGEAAGAEWRTAPLAGIGRRLAAGARLLHDGRAADIATAVAWHDGEAASARARFDALDPGDRDALTAWLKEWR